MKIIKVGGKMMMNLVGGFSTTTPLIRSVQTFPTFCILLFVVQLFVIVQPFSAGNFGDFVMAILINMMPLTLMLVTFMMTKIGPSKVVSS